MILRIEFNGNWSKREIDTFCKYPKGTCLDSGNNVNITPRLDNFRLSFWYISDTALIHFYGGITSIHALTTVPGIIKVSVILADKDISYYDIKAMSDSERTDLLLPFI